MENYNNTILLPHNQEAFQKVMEHFHSNSRAAVVHATGTGKSFIIAAVASRFAGRIVVIAPNTFVLDETRKLCGGKVDFRTYASVMYDESPASDYELIVLDEFHRAGADEWGKGVDRLLDANPDAKVLGTSATAIRYLDGQRNMSDELFDGNVVSSLPLREAIDRGIIPEPTYVASLYAFDETYDAVKSQIMASNKKSEEEKMKAMRTLDGIAHNWENAHGVGLIMRKYIDKDIKRIIVFCSKVARAAKTRKVLGPWLASAGYKHIRFYNIDYKEKRLKKEMADFQNDHFDGVKVAISVNMLNEGVHIPNVDAVIMMRSTVSPNIIMQQIGRCLTAKKTGHKPVIIDLVNNMDTLGLLNLWSFSDTKASSGEQADDCSMNKGLPFHVIDECRDIRTFLTQVQTEFDVVTDFYPKFWEFIEKNNRLPKCSARDENKLYGWCGRVWRNKYGLAERFPDVYAKLEKMRFGNVFNMQAYGKFEQLKKFVGKYERLPKSSVEGEKPLYEWYQNVVNNRHRLAERLPDAYKFIMDILGTKNLSSEEKTNLKLEATLKFVENNGRMPKKSVKEEYPLYNWCKEILSNRNGLAERFPEVYAKLKKMKEMERVDIKSGKLLSFVEVHKRLPKRSEPSEERLYRFCLDLLNNKKNARELNPMGWNIIKKYSIMNKKDRQIVHIKELKSFVERNGRLPKRSIREELPLYSWCIRVKRNPLWIKDEYPEILDLFQKYNLIPIKDHSKKRVKEFWEFVNTHGKLPKNSVKEEKSLYIWCSRVFRNNNGLAERFPEVYTKIIELKEKK